VCTDYLKYEPTERFDLVTLIMYDFCALGPAQRKSLLTRISACLKQGGALLLDVYSMTAFKERETTAYLEKNQLDHFWCEDEYYCFVTTFKYDAQAVTLDKYSVFTRGGASETIYNWLQYFSPDTLCDELRDAGLVKRFLLGDVAGRSFSDDLPEFAVIAERV
ncbi:MAG: class I SAM-dependent methyltransferase, partial [Pseudomonadota bacterium]